MYSYQSLALFRMKRCPLDFGGLLTTHKAKSFADPQPWAVLQNVVASANYGPSHPTEGPARALNTFNGLSTGMERCRPL